MPRHHTPFLLKLLYEYMSKQLSLNDARENYIKALDALDDNPDAWLQVLLARDQVDIALPKERSSLIPSTLEQIHELDEWLREVSTQIPREQVIWRDLIHPQETAWWWWMDMRNAEQTQRKDRWWDILTGTSLLLSSTLVVDIIRQFWVGTPDTVSILATLLVLLLTTGPLVKQGRILLEWIPKTSQWQKAKTRALASLSVFLILLLMHQWAIPCPFATYYNSLGRRRKYLTTSPWLSHWLLIIYRKTEGH